MPKRSRTCPSYLSRAEAARLPGVTPQTIKNWIDDGILQEVVIAGRSHVILSEVQAKAKSRVAKLENEAARIKAHLEASA